MIRRDGGSGPPPPGSTLTCAGRLCPSASFPTPCSRPPCPACEFDVAFSTTQASSHTHLLIQTFVRTTDNAHNIAPIPTRRIDMITSPPLSSRVLLLCAFRMTRRRGPRSPTPNHSLPACQVCPGSMISPPGEPASRTAYIKREVMRMARARGCFFTAWERRECTSPLDATASLP